jgi:DNA-binding MarR family transcriptional regulator
MVQRLERGGMIERRADPLDARAQLVYPTPRSRLLESMVRRAWASLDEILIAELGSGDALRLQKLAGAATRVLERSQD